MLMGAPATTNSTEGQHSSQPPVFIWDTTSTFVCVREGTAVERCQSISISSNLNVSIFLFIFCSCSQCSEAVQAGESSVRLHQYKTEWCQFQKVQLHVQVFRIIE